MRKLLNKKILIPAIALGIAATGATLWSTGVVKAEGNGNRQSMTSELASKLNIDESKVSDAFSQINQEKQAQKQEEMSKKLDQAVTDGVITADQKQKILDKQTEMQKKREKQQQEMQTWESENGIDMSKLRDYGLGGGRGHGGPGGPEM